MNNMRLAKMAEGCIDLYKWAKQNNRIKLWANVTSYNINRVISKAYSASELISSYPYSPSLTDTMITTPIDSSSDSIIARNYLMAYKQIYHLALSNHRRFFKYDAHNYIRRTSNMLQHHRLPSKCM